MFRLHVRPGKPRETVARGFWRRQVEGVGVQGAALTAASAYAFAAPRILGLHAYGVAALVLTGPYLLQLALESVIVPSVTRWAETPDALARKRLRRLVQDGVVVAAVGAVATMGLSFAEATFVEAEAPLVLAGLCSLYVVLVVGNAYLIGYAYAVRSHGALITCYGLAAPTFVGTLLALSAWGPHGMLGALCVTNLLVALVLAKRLGYEWLSVLTADGEPVRNMWRQTYLPMVSPRLAQLVLNQGTTLLAGVQMAPSDLAVYRVTLSLIAGTAYLVPLSPTVLQRSVQDDMATSSQSLHMHGLWALLGAFAGAVVLMLAFIRWGPEVRGVVLGVSDARGAAFDVMFWGIPFYAVIPAVSAYVIGTNGEQTLVRGFGACLLSAGATSWGFGVPYGFLVGSIAFVVTTVVSHGMALRARVGTRWCGRRK